MYADQLTADAFNPPAAPPSETPDPPAAGISPAVRFLTVVAAAVRVVVAEATSPDGRAVWGEWGRQVARAVQTVPAEVVGGAVVDAAVGGLTTAATTLAERLAAAVPPTE